MHEFMKHALDVIIFVFLVSTMLGAGLSLTARQILDPLHNKPLVISSLVTSFVLVPIIAVVITRVFSLDEPLREGLILLSMVAGSEAGPKVIGIAKGNVPFAVGLLAMQLVVTVIYVPLVLSVLLPEVSIDHGKILIKLFAAVLLPMGLGLLIKARFATIAERLGPLMRHTSTVFMLLMTVLIILLNSGAILGLFGSRAVLAGTVFVVISFIVGYLLGGKGKDKRLTLGFMSGARNASISLMIADQVFQDPKVLLMITVAVIMMIIILFPLALLLGRQNAKAGSGITFESPRREEGNAAKN